MPKKRKNLKNVAPGGLIDFILGITHSIYKLRLSTMVLQQENQKTEEGKVKVKNDERKSKSKKER